MEILKNYFSVSLEVLFIDTYYIRLRTVDAPYDWFDLDMDEIDSSVRYNSQKMENYKNVTCLFGTRLNMRQFFGFWNWHFSFSNFINKLCTIAEPLKADISSLYSFEHYGFRIPNRTKKDVFLTFTINTKSPENSFIQILYLEFDRTVPLFSDNQILLSSEELFTIPEMKSAEDMKIFLKSFFPERNRY